MKQQIARSLARVTVTIGILGVLGAATAASGFAWRLAPAADVGSAPSAVVGNQLSSTDWRLLHQLTFEPAVLADSRVFTLSRGYGADWLALAVDPQGALAAPRPMSPEMVAQLTFAPWELAGE
jgi:hypothetical protein